MDNIKQIAVEAVVVTGLMLAFVALATADEPNTPNADPNFLINSYSVRNLSHAPSVAAIPEGLCMYAPIVTQDDVFRVKAPRIELVCRTLGVAYVKN